MKTKILAVILGLAFSQSVSAQQTETKNVPKEANPADVASIDSIIKAVHNVISGNAGEKRN